jgi:hypothetical protein
LSREKASDTNFLAGFFSLLQFNFHNESSGLVRSAAKKSIFLFAVFANQRAAIPKARRPRMIRATTLDGLIRAGKGYTSWYVGQSCRTTILKEAFNNSNLNKYHNVMNIKGNSGTPMIFLLPILTDGGSKFRKPARQDGGLAAVAFLEQWLNWAGVSQERGVNKRSLHKIFEKYARNWDFQSKTR